jgi:hypothetical protein
VKEVIGETIIKEAREVELQKREEKSAEVEADNASENRVRKKRGVLVKREEVKNEREV